MTEDKEKPVWLKLTTALKLINNVGINISRPTLLTWFWQQKNQARKQGGLWYLKAKGVDKFIEEWQRDSD